MKNKHHTKRIFILIIMLFISSINSIAAVVSDNDGSAFITKSEFDSLKTNFLTQINQYNMGIDNKLDSAISGYLNGIKISQEPSNYFTLIKKALGNVMFLNSVKTTNSTITTNEVLNIYRHYFQKRYDGMNYITRFFPGTYPETNSLKWTYAVALVKSGTESSFTDQNGATYIALRRNGNWDGVGDTAGQWLKAVGGAWTEIGTQASMSTKNVYGTKNANTEVAGIGSVYRYKTTPSGRKVITQYASSFYPVCNINVYAHSYIDYAKNFSTNYCGSNLQKDTTSLSCTVGSLTSYGSVGTGTPYASNYSGANGTRWAAQVYNIIITDNIKYEQMIWGLVPSTSISCIDEQATLGAGSSKTSAASVTASTISAEYWGKAEGMEVKDVALSGVAVTYTPPKLTTTANSLSSFSNDYVSTVIGDTVYHGQGIKIGKMPQDGDCKVTLKFKNANSENASFRYILTDGKVGVTGTSILSNYTNVNCNGSTTVTKTIHFDKERELWINCYSNTTGVNLILDSVELKLDR